MEVKYTMKRPNEKYNTVAIICNVRILVKETESSEKLVV